MANPQTIQIYLPSGNPAGLRMASLTTRTVRVLEIPRSLLGDFLKRRESSRVGVYFLFGPETEEGRRAYIGQSGNVGKRLQEHAASKDWWTKAMVAVSLTDEWTSTHVTYLEWLSVDRASIAGRYRLDNGNQGSNPHTPEPLEADCNEFLDTIGVLLATLGVPILEQVQETIADGARPEGMLYFREAGCGASGYQTPEGLLVQSGSFGRADLRKSATPALGRLRDALREQGVFSGQRWAHGLPKGPPIQQSLCRRRISRRRSQQRPHLLEERGRDRSESHRSPAAGRRNKAFGPDRRRSGKQAHIRKLRSVVV